MPYYQAGDYYRGDYYRGDFLGLGKLAKKVLNVGSGIVGKLGIPFVSGAANLVQQATANRTQLPMIVPTALGGGYKPEPGVSGAVHRLLPGGETGYYRTRRMDPLNVKALRRAGRRVKGFLKIARRLGALPVNRGKGKRIYAAPRRKK